MGKKKRRSPPGGQDYGMVPAWSIGDPAFADFLRVSGISLTGDLGEHGALGLTAFYRACALLSGTIAGLPLKVYEKVGDRREERDHYLSTNPAGPYDMSPFAWTETLILQQCLHGENFLKTIETAVGEVVGLWPLHPMAVSKVEWQGADKVFSVGMADGSQERYVTGEVTHVPVMSSDGLRGLSPLSVFRQSLQTAKAGEAAANRSFVTGSLVAGMVTTEEDVDETEAKAIKASLDAKMAGPDSAGAIAFVNRSLKFSPWTMSNVDRQFLESRRFSTEEIARMFGLPVNLLSVAGAVSNWGTGIAESNLALQRFVLMAYTSRIESALRAVLPPGWYAEFDYRGLLQGTPQQEIDALVKQVEGGLLTVDEARAKMNLPPRPAMPAPPQETPDAPI